VGVHKTGESAVNRNWQIAQGSIIANAGPRLEDIHPIIVEGSGHVSITNVEAFSGHSAVLTTQPMSEDFMLVTGTEKLTASLIGCRMMNHRAERPITRRNEKAIIQMHGCFDKNEQPLNGLAP
jgi:hypothetical protein